MRRRLLAALAGLAIGTLLLYAVPRAFVLSDMVREQERRKLERTADLLEEVLDYRLVAGLRIDASTTNFLVGPDEELVITRSDGTRFAVGSVELEQLDAVTTRRTLQDGTQVTVRLSGASVDRRVSDMLLNIVLIGSAAMAVAIVLARSLSRRLSEPFTELAAHADRFGLTDGGEAPRSGLPEADRLADALDRSRVRIAELLRAEREFSSNASHQLRTPLSALRLRVEDLAHWPETAPVVREELDAALVEIDRLAGTVTDLLELARSGGIGGWTEIELGDVVDRAVTRWRPQFAADGRRVAIPRVSHRPTVTASERSIDLVLDVLLENALAHGRGSVDVTVQDLETHVAVRVADEGTMDPAIGRGAFDRSVRSSASNGSGIGLALARSIAESSGARLQLVSRDPTVFELDLPCARTSLPNC